MIKKALIIFVIAQFASFSYANSHQINLVAKSLSKRGISFANIEHQEVGDLVKLSFGANEPAKSAQQLTLKNGMKLTYGDILTLAGDFFGNENQSISDCKEEDRVACFLSHFNNLDRKGHDSDTGCDSAFFQKNQYLKIFKQTAAEIEAARKKGIPEYEVYESYGGSLNKKYNTISCGGSAVSDLVPFGKYIKLAAHNWDHFAPYAVDAYKAGHQAALNEALRAYHAWHDEHNPTKARHLLTIAYAKNAFASHFLTDTFSAGHMRVPRKEIHQQVHMIAALNLLLANFQHDEDNKHGLEVMNQRGDRWHAYGDHYLLIDEAKEHHRIVVEAVQASADGIYETYQTGVIPHQDSALSYIPMYEKIADMNGTAPLFKLDKDGVVLLRQNLLDIYNFSYTRNWNGFITFITLEIMANTKKKT